MKQIHFFILCFTILVASFILAASVAFEWEKKMVIHPEGMDISYAQFAGGQGEDDEQEEGNDDSDRRVIPKIETGTSQKIWKDTSGYHARYRFVNFNRDRLIISFSMPSNKYKKYLAGYGYTDEEYEALKAWRNKAYETAWKEGYLKGGEAAAKKAINEVEVEYDTRLRGLLYRKGMALRSGNVVECDMPNIVKRNIAELRPLALAFQNISEKRNYGSEETLGAVVSMAQTAIRYKIPPIMEGNRHTGGLLPPLRSVLSGWGDCDTKTGVIASILGNWNGIKMVDIAVPRHYLMAIRRLPAKGDMFVRYEGLEYVLIEAAGPAWLEPGMVGRNTAALLSGSEGYVIEPFF